ncbi:glycosyltransferase [Celeribacter halophilus]|uniref:glycosyltransferase n=1 Tax=Celeribacter halophilus TaxID=576117 RepID=UPI003A8F09B6
MPPQISVVIPSFNSETFLPETLDSLARQKDVGFEIILSDGGSSDGTIDLVRKVNFAEKIIISKPDRGVPHALNRGMAQAKAPVLCWLNTDDVYLRPDTLALACEALSVESKTASPGFAYGSCMTLNKAGYVKRRLVAFAPKEKDVGRGANLFTGSLFFTRATWNAFGGFSEKNRIAFEYELVKSCFSQSRPHLIPHYLAAFRQYEDGLSSKFQKQMQTERETIFGVSKGHKLRAPRILAQVAQGTLGKTVMNRISARDHGRHWSEVFGCEL